MSPDLEITSASTRGERNRNPGNLDCNPNITWQGQIGIETVPPNHTCRARFAVFMHDVFGIRAIAKLLHTYIAVDGYDTVAKIVWHWAPPTDNNYTRGYIDFVAKECEVGPDDVITVSCLEKMVPAIITEENGRCLYVSGVIQEAIQLALGA